jgi:sarcosine oxidase subunit gamma
MTDDVTRHRRRSFVYRKLDGARFQERGWAGVAVAFDSLDAEIAAARHLGLADFCPLPRTGFKGPGAAAWLESQGLRLEAAHNRAYPQRHGIALRLSPGEIWILDDPQRLELSWRLDNVWSLRASGCYHVPRGDSHGWFRVVGASSAEMFSRLCAVDFRPHKFANHAIAQTVVAKIGGVVVRDDIGTVPAFHLLADSASAEYLWDVLIDAFAEFDGRRVGVAALAALAE